MDRYATFYGEILMDKEKPHTARLQEGLAIAGAMILQTNSITRTI